MRPVVWSTQARQDYLDILRYVARDNPIAAERVVDAIERAGIDLGSFATEDRAAFQAPMKSRSPACPTLSPMP